MSQQALGRQFKHLYHESPISNRESIRDKGLVAAKTWTPTLGPDIAPHGVYLSEPGASEYGSSMHDAPHFGYDRWRVNVEGLGVQRDPDTGHSTSHYLPHSVGPERLWLVKKGDPNWEKNI